MVERPQPVDDRNVIARARAKADTVADLARENLNLASVSPFARRWKMLRGVGRRLSRFDFFNDGIDPFANPFVPIFFFDGRLPAHDKSTVSAAAVSHVRRAAIRTVGEISHLDDAAGRMAAPVEGHRSGAPAARNRGF